jgi:hypothetical protein
VNDGSQSPARVFSPKGQQQYWDRDSSMVNVPNPIMRRETSDDYGDRLSQGVAFSDQDRDPSYVSPHGAPSPQPRSRMNTAESQATIESQAMQSFRKNLLMFYDDMDAEEDAIAESNEAFAKRGLSSDSNASSVMSLSDRPSPPGGYLPSRK